MTTQQLTIGRIQQIVADRYDIPIDVLLSPRRSARVAWPRQIAMWASVKLLPGKSLPQIGRAFDRDHTTVLHAENVVDQRRQIAAGEIESVLDEIARDGFKVTEQLLKPRRRIEKS